MYKIQKKPDFVTSWNGQAEVTLKDEYGGVAHIMLDDHCYILILERHPDESEGKGYVISKWWFKEACEAMKGLPLPT